MELQPIENSSNITAVGYDADTTTLRVQFANGAEYDYSDVPKETADDFIVAESAGKFFHAVIRNLFDGVRVEKESD